MALSSYVAWTNVAWTETFTYLFLYLKRSSLLRQTPKFLHKMFYISSKIFFCFLNVQISQPFFTIGRCYKTFFTVTEGGLK